jgi:hypothetical protein
MMLNELGIDFYNFSGRMMGFSDSPTERAILKATLRES